MFNPSKAGMPEKPKSPADELEFLRTQMVKKHEDFTKVEHREPTQDEENKMALELIKSYKSAKKAEVLDALHKSMPVEEHSLTLRLSPETHDDRIGELYGIMMEHGVKSALEVVTHMQDPHLDDDFQRFLSEYLVSQHKLPGLSPSQELYKAIDMRLFEVTLPRPSEDKKQGYKELIQLMEQFYAGMLAVAGDANNRDRNYFTLEIAMANSSPHIVFYACVPNHKVSLFEKQVNALYHDVKITEVFDDYNIFCEGGASVGAYAQATVSDVLQLKTYDHIEHDPLHVLLNAFSKIEKKGEGAAIQFVVMPVGQTLIKEYGQILDEVKKGKKLKKAIAYVTQLHTQFLSDVGSILFDDSKKEKPEAHQDYVTSISEKLKSTIIESHVRIVASAQTEARARQILDDMKSAFNQFTDTTSTGLHFTEPSKSGLQDFLHSFSYRLYNRRERLTLNFKELATLFHFPATVEDQAELKQSKAAVAPPPIELSDQGIILGENVYQNKVTKIHFAPEDRMRHFYVIGQTGTGKTGIFMNMIAQDIKAGHGVCYIDPHGTDIQTILSFIPPERMDDVIYFDPAYTPRPIGLNMLEFDADRPEQKSLVIDELMGIFNQLFNMEQQGGAMFQQYFKNAAMAVMSHPESGCTLLEITRVIAEKEFRDMKLSHCTNPIVHQFWKSAEETSGEQSLSNFVPYISSKFDPFISNEIMRPVVLQEKSAFNMREVMDNKKILLVNLSKGRLGELNANLIGMVIVGKIQMAALSRVDSYGKKFEDFFLYIDEFQNVTTPAISSILSEARKYRLSINMAHQFMAQLKDNIRDAVLGNVGSMAIFRISSEDAKALEPRVKPTFSWEDITKLDNRNAYLSMLAGGQPVKPFNMVTENYPPSNKEQVENIKQLSYLKYGRPRDEVESEVMAKYKKAGY